ncbi:hypothetical protein B0J11DRAFT_523860 [Dendryphion nanum]|uniref:Uncharacterized protein n=1 Tax=Dendryphion nanum TaxID=256645 RepID=A0A9P9ITN3_9PLEO|nr:hypothetical protein B0J11DRAFT_523860 [Dendryphion nanum]
MDPPQTSGFLRIPVELRHCIYGYLIRDTPVDYPFKNTLIYRISHKAPPRQLLLTSHQIREEVLMHYYGSVTLSIFHFGSSRPAREDLNHNTLTALRRATKVQLLLFWILTEEEAEALPSTLLWGLEDRTLLLRDDAPKLNLVTIILSFSNTSSWREREFLLKPLQILKGKVKFVLGHNSLKKLNDIDTWVEMQRYIKALNS